MSETAGESLPALRRAEEIHLYVERDDFRENPPKKWFRLAPGREVRLRYGYYVTCVNVVKDDKTGEVAELHCCGGICFRCHCEKPFYGLLWSGSELRVREFVLDNPICQMF